MRNVCIVNFHVLPFRLGVSKTNISPFPVEEFGEKIYPTMDLGGDSYIKIACADKKYKAGIYTGCWTGLGLDLTGNNLISGAINPEYNLLLIHSRAFMEARWI